MAKDRLPTKAENLSDWYTKLIQVADLADYGPAKGTMIFKPYGYAIWEQVQKAMDAEIKARGVQNAYFPLFIPMSLLDKEKSHVAGFSPELAVVTHGGGEELEEPLAVRPTSEAIMYEAYARWIQSYRDLPVMINQWNNVVRWEKRTYMFMRTSEFLWQEGHTAHATHEEAVELQKWAMDMYQRIYNEHFAMFGYVGYKSESERFAGADATLTFEALMPSGKALQSCTSHDLGQNFAKAFDIKFQDKEGGESLVWQTSWGLSTRSIGGLILAHGDDNGLKLPPKIAPVQVVVLPVRADDSAMNDYATKLVAQLKEQGIRAELDAREGETIGYRINKWEVKGAPVRVEIGGREVDDETVTVARRDTGEKETHKAADFLKSAQALLDLIQSDMFKAHQQFTEENTRVAKDYDEFKAILKEHKGFVKVNWQDDAKSEAAIQYETKATSRARLLEPDSSLPGKDFHSGKPASDTWVFAQSY